VNAADTFAALVAAAFSAGIVTGVLVMIMERNRPWP